MTVMGCCGSARNLAGNTPVAPQRRKAAPAVQEPQPSAFVLRDAYAMPVPGGWPLRVGSGVVTASSMQDARRRLRLAGLGASEAAAQDNICRELIAMGRPEACRPSGTSGDSRYYDEDAAYDRDPRGPAITKGTYGADGAAWRRLHLRALDGRMDASYLRYFATVIGCWRCQVEWTEMVKAHPFRPDDAFAWTVERHNQVNQRRNVPTITVEDALALWN